MANTSIIDTKRAIERLLTNTFSTLKIAYEGVDFKAPNDQLYLAVNFRVNSPDDPTFGREYYRENITCTVLVVDTINKGTSGAYTIAGQVRDLLDKGNTFIEGTTRIHVLRTPQVAGSAITNQRVVVPVIISLVVEVQRT